RDTEREVRLESRSVELFREQANELAK
ncbi:MAG: hypothetical protein QOG48_2111, partial [Verrucomicrobiota bacterium]